MSNIPTQKTLTVGGTVFTDLDNLIILTATAQVPGASASSFRRGNDTAAYTPSGANKFRVKAYKILSGATTTVSLGYADNDRGMSSNTGATNEVYFNGSNLGSYIVYGLPVGETQESSINFLCLNGKYLTIDASAGTCTVFLYGYEEA